MGSKSFSEALIDLKMGHKVQRDGWNGKGMWVTLMKGYPEGVKSNQASQEAYSVLVGTVIRVLPYLAMKTAPGARCPWLASQTDILADDWSIV